MKTKMVTAILVTLFLASMLSMAFVTPAKAQYLTDPYTVGLWHFDEGTGTTAYDSSGYDNHGTISGATWVDGKFGKALQFDGIDDYVEVPASPSLAIADAITIEVWVYLLSAPTNMRIECRPYSTEEWAAPYADYELVVLNEAGWGGYPGRAVYFGLTLDGSWTYFATTDTVPLNTWTHLAATYDGSNMKIYINGQERASKSASGTIGTSGNPLFIGTRTPVPSEVFDGIIDEVRISNIARTISVDINPDALNLKSNGGWVTSYIEIPGWELLFSDAFERTELGLDWTEVSGTWAVEEGELSGEGIGTEAWTYINEEFSGDMIIGFKIKFLTSPADVVGKHGGIMSFASSQVDRWDTSGYTIDWIDREEDRGYRIYRWDNGAYSLLGILPGDIEEGQWYSWKIVKSGSVIELYVDGMFLGSVTDPGVPYTGGYIGLWLYSNGQHAHFDNIVVTSYVSEIDLSTVNLYVGTNPVPAEDNPKYSFVTDMYSYIADVDGDSVQERIVKFNRAEVTEYLKPYIGEEVTLTISGKLLDETPFAVSYTVKVIKPGK